MVVFTAGDIFGFILLGAAVIYFLYVIIRGAMSDRAEKPKKEATVAKTPTKEKEPKGIHPIELILIFLFIAAIAAAIFASSK